MNKRYAMVNGKEIAQVLQTPFTHIECGDDVFDHTHYYDEATREIRPKLAFDYVLDIEGLTVTLTGLPEGVLVETNGMDTLTDDKPVVITYDVPDTYEIQLSGCPECLNTGLEVFVGDA